jgi:hypothetical protein
MWQPRMLFAAAGRGKGLFTYFGILVFCVVWHLKSESEMDAQWHIFILNLWLFLKLTLANIFGKHDLFSYSKLFEILSEPVVHLDFLINRNCFLHY